MLRTLLVPLDGSTLAERALPIACDIARRTGGVVHLVRTHVPIAVVGATAEGAIFSQDMLAADDALRQRARKYTEELSTRLGAEWGLRVQWHVEDGTPAGLVTDIADRINADLIVMTTHGAGGFTPDWLGSVADSVIRHSHRPVLALPENDAHLGEPFTPRRVLVTLDGSPRSETILPVVRDLAIAFGAHIELVRVVAPFVPGDSLDILSTERPDPFGVDAETVAAKATLDRIAKELEASGVKATATVRVELSPTRTLIDHVKETNPDCLAIATQGRGFSRIFLGSVADKLIRSAQRPVLVLRPPKG
jgi:nucleotide-binding universal stress UspA family protein